MKVWAIFSVENEYYQPSNNLEVLFRNKPNFEELSNFFFKACDKSEVTNDDKDFLTGLILGRDLRYQGYDYRLEEVDVIDNQREEVKK